jgi:hypothetical protein
LELPLSYRQIVCKIFDSKDLKIKILKAKSLSGRQSCDLNRVYGELGKDGTNLRLAQG